MEIPKKSWVGHNQQVFQLLDAVSCIKRQGLKFSTRAPVCAVCISPPNLKGRKKTFESGTIFSYSAHSKHKKK